MKALTKRMLLQYELVANEIGRQINQIIGEIIDEDKAREGLVSI